MVTLDRSCRRCSGKPLMLMVASAPTVVKVLKDGGRDRTRTCDLLRVKNGFLVPRTFTQPHGVL